jgi:hypothetical protein
MEKTSRRSYRFLFFTAIIPPIIGIYIHIATEYQQNHSPHLSSVGHRLSEKWKVEGGRWKVEGGRKVEGSGRKMTASTSPNCGVNVESVEAREARNVFYGIGETLQSLLYPENAISRCYTP